MPLLECPECGGQVSSQAEKCPRCGTRVVVVFKCPECFCKVSGDMDVCPFCGVSLRNGREVGQAAGGDGGPWPAVQTIERTSKVWKGQMLLSAGLVGIGVVGCVSGEPMFGILTMVGLVWFVVARVMAWWHHG